MASYISPAFLQQCFAMHRLDLVIKQIKGSAIIVFCRSCRLRHTVRVALWDDAVPGPSTDAAAVLPDALIQCATAHLPAIGVHAVDVVQSYLDVSCAECRATYPFTFMECVTRSASQSLPSS